jgi:O-antigen biosynthesis protein
MQANYLFRKVINKFSLLPKRKQCNICGNKVYDYLPLPDHYQKNFEQYGFPYTQKGAFETIDTDHFFCPDCYSMDRERLYAWYLKNNIKLAKNSSFLDFAPSASLSKWIKKNFTCQYVTADLFMDDVDVKTDIEDMRVFDTASFDFVICSHVMEHVSNDVKAMGEIYRVMKPGAKAIIMTPILKNFDGVDEDPACTDVAERWRRFGQDDHIRLYSQKIFTSRLKEVGFTLELITGGQIPAEDKAAYGLPANAVLYLVNK